MEIAVITGTWKVPFIASCWQIKSRGVGPPQGSLFYSGKGRGLGAQESFVILCRSGNPERLLIEPTEATARLCPENWVPGGKENCNRKEKKQRQKLFFCCTKEGDDPRPLVTQEEAYLEK